MDSEVSSKSYITFRDAATGAIKATGFRDISEPTPVDVFNNADKICINSQWYDAGSPEAIALADSNGNNIPDLFDPYAHNIANIFAKDSSIANPSYASSSNYTLSSAPLLTGGQFRRLGHIITDYDFKYNMAEDWFNASQDDPWTTVSDNMDSIYDGKAVKYQLEPGNVQKIPGMLNMRGHLMWWGAGVIYVNDENEDTGCGWDNL